MRRNLEEYEKRSNTTYLPEKRKRRTRILRIRKSLKVKCSTTFWKIMKKFSNDQDHHADMNI